MNVIRLIPAARNSDPITSHLSDRYISETGIRKKQAEIVENLVRHYPGCTARELSMLTTTDFEVIHKRLSECANVVKRGIVKCTITGRPATIWGIA